MRYLFLLLTSAIFAPPAPIVAQVPLDIDPGGSVRTRADLERLLEEYEAALASPAYSESVKRSARVEAERIRDRLEYGDFRVGDRIEITVQGEPNFPVTVTVQPGPVIVLDVFGEIPLHGVLRSELTSHLTEQLRRFIRDPVVRATAQLRLAVFGSVGSPGFYNMPVETQLGEVVMLAGGPGSGADLDNMTIERSGRSLFRPEEIQTALRSGLTLDQLNLQAGDQIMIPATSSTSTTNVLRNMLTIAGVITSLTFLLQRMGVF